MNFVYFDFDGTLADSFAQGIEIANYLAPKYNFQTVDKSKIEYYRSLSAQELIKEFKVPLIKIPFLAPIFKIELNKRINTLNPFSGILQMLKTLSSKYYIGILTSNSVDNVEIFLKNHNFIDYISDIRSEFHLFGKHNSLKKIISKHKISKDRIIYVGDETRDIEASKKVGIKIIAVNWGFNSEKALKKYNPDKIANSTNDIVDFIDEYFN